MKKLLQGRIMGLNKRYWLAQTQWILFPGSPVFAETEALMNRSVTGACGSTCTVQISPPAHSKSFEGFFLRGEAIASVVKNVTKTLCLRRSRWAAGEPRALQSSSWAKSLLWSVRILLCFFTRQYWGWNVRAGQSSAAHRMEQICCSSPSCTATDTAKCHHSHAHYLYFFDVTCLESCHQLAHTLRHCVPRLGTQMTTDWESFQPALRAARGFWVTSTPQPHPREQDLLTKHPCVALLLINTPQQLLSTSLQPYACYIHKSTFSLEMFKLKLLINPLRWSRWICQLTIRTPFC